MTNYLTKKETKTPNIELTAAEVATCIIPVLLGMVIVGLVAVLMLL